MTLSRSPSPALGGGWSSPGLDINTSGRSSPSPAFPDFVKGQQPSSWESSATSRNRKMYPGFETQNQGFFQRHMRRISNSLPRFNSSTYYAEKEKLQRGRWAPAPSTSLYGRVRTMAGRAGRKSKLRATLGLFVVLLLCAAWMLLHRGMLHVCAWALGISC